MLSVAPLSPTQVTVDWSSNKSKYVRLLSGASDSPEPIPDVGGIHGPDSPGSQVHLLPKVVPKRPMAFSRTRNCGLYLQTVRFPRSADSGAGPLGDTGAADTSPAITAID